MNYNLNIRSWNPKTKTVGSGEDTHVLVIDPPSYRLVINEDWEGVTDQSQEGPGIKIAYIVQNGAFTISNGGAWQVAFQRRGWSKRNKQILGIDGFSLGPEVITVGKVPLNSVDLSDLSGSKNKADYVSEIMRIQAFTSLMNELFGPQKQMSGCKALFDYEIVSGDVQLTHRHPVIFSWELTHPSSDVATDGQIDIYALSGSATGVYQFKLDSDSFADMTTTGTFHQNISGLGNGSYNLRTRDKANATSDFTSPSPDLVLDFNLG